MVELNPAVLLKLYILGEKLGEGGFGKVYRGIHCFTREEVAIKSIELSDRSAELAFKELRTLTNLTHPHIIRMHHAFHLESRLVLVMELGGRSLKDYVYHRRYLEEPETRALIAQLLAGVDYCHKRRLVHRDLKLENIVFARDAPYPLKIIDFGIAGLAAHESSHMCTLRYAAP